MSNFTRRLSGVLGVVALCVLVLAGCGGRHKKISTVVSIAVTPTAPSITVGATQQFTATATNKDGTQTDITSQVTWKSGTTAVATISTAGLATGVTAGTSAITATLGTIVSTPAVTLTVTAPTLLSIAVTPVSPTIAVGGNQQFTATGTYSDGSHPDITTQVTWSSGTMAVATINPTTGLANGVAVGTSAITATLGTVVSPADTLTVSAVVLQTISILPASPTVGVGQVVDFTATGHYSDGSTAPLPNATWSTGTAATASISSPGGVAVALATGTSSITATSGAVTSPGDTLTVQPAVAHGLYAPGVTDGYVSIYALNSASSTAYPIGSSIVNNSPLQVIPEPTGRFAFVLLGIGINTVSVDPASGRLTVDVPVSLGTSYSPNQGVVDPTGRFLYIAGSGGATNLHSYTISPVDGSLTEIGAGINVGSSLAAVITDRAGKFLYVTDQGSTSLFAYAINQSTGALTPLATPSYTVGNAPQYPAIDPSHTHLFVPNFTDNSISVFTIAANGSLTPVPPPSSGVGNGPSVAVVDATGKYLYVTNVADGTVSGFSIAGSGALTALATSPFTAGNSPFGIAIDPGNSTVVVANVISNTLSVYSLNAVTGNLTPATLPQIETAANPFLVNFGIAAATPAVNPGAVFAANPGSNDISAFTSTAGTAVLTAAASSPTTGLTGNSIAAADRQGKLLFTGDVANTNIAGFSIDQSTGALTALTGSPLVVTGPDFSSAIYLDPSSSNAYVLDVTAGTVVQDTVDTTAGTVSSPVNIVPGFVGATSLVADPQGDFVYVLGNDGTNGILPFTTYNTGGGALNGTTSTPYPGNWTSGAVDGSGQFLVAVDSTAKSLHSFSIVPAGTFAGTDGAVTDLGGSVSLVGGPWLVAFDPQDRVVYVADKAAGTVTPYGFSSASGALGAAGAVTTVSVNGLTSISTDITGTYLYVGVDAAAAPGSKGAVAVYSIGAGGALTVVAGSPFTTGTGNAGIAATNVVQ